MTPAQRITAIRESAVLLAQQDWNDIDLILAQHGVGLLSNPWQSDDRYGYVVRRIEDISDDTLQGLHQYVLDDCSLHKNFLRKSSDVPAEPQPWRAKGLKLFMSHLAHYQGIVAQVGQYLDWYGVTSFVAHVSIEPSVEWQGYIEAALRSCDVMAVFLHQGFHESYWCDQEVGFALARRVPVLPIAIDVLPYGFMAKLQAARSYPNEHPLHISQKVLQWLIRTPSVQPSMAEGLVTAFEQSGSFSNTRILFGLIEQMSTFTPVQLKRLEAATENNYEVTAAVLGSNNIPDLIRKLIIERGGSLANPPSGYSGEPPF